MRPHNHPAYNDAVRQAVKLAAAGSECIVYLNDKGMFVLPYEDPRPSSATIVCIAQQWNEFTVQLRFPGATSEWVHSS